MTEGQRANHLADHKQFYQQVSPELNLAQAKLEQNLKSQVETLFLKGGRRKLVKKGKRFGLTTTRFYTIHSERLHYFKSSDSKDVKGIIELREKSLKVDFEHKKITKDMLFGIRIEQNNSKNIFWLIFSSQADNILFFKYFKLLNGQFKVSRLPTINSTKGQEGSIFIFTEGNVNELVEVIGYDEQIPHEKNQNKKEQSFRRKAQSSAREIDNLPNSQLGRPDSQYNLEYIMEEEGKKQHEQFSFKIHNSSNYFGDNAPFTFQQGQQQINREKKSSIQLLRDSANTLPSVQIQIEHARFKGNESYDSLQDQENNQQQGIKNQGDQNIEEEKIQINQTSYQHYGDYENKPLFHQSHPNIIIEEQKEESLNPYKQHQLSAILNDSNRTQLDKENNEKENKDKVNDYEDLNGNSIYFAQLEQIKQHSKAIEDSIRQHEIKINEQRQSLLYENEGMNMSLPLTPLQSDGFSQWFQNNNQNKFAKTESSNLINQIHNFQGNSLDFIEFRETPRKQSRDSDDRLSLFQQIQSFTRSKSFAHPNKSKLAKSAPQSPSNQFVNSFQECENIVDEYEPDSQQARSNKNTCRTLDILSSNTLQNRSHSDILDQNPKIFNDAEEEEQRKTDNEQFSLLQGQGQQASSISTDNGFISNEELKYYSKNVSTIATITMIKNKQQAVALIKKNTNAQAGSVLYPSTFKQKRSKNEEDINKDQNEESYESMDEAIQKEFKEIQFQGQKEQQMKNPVQQDKFLFLESEIYDHNHSQQKSYDQSIENCQDEHEEGIKHIQIEKAQKKYFIQDYNNKHSPASYYSEKSVLKQESIKLEENQGLQENIYSGEEEIQEISEDSEDGREGEYFRESIKKEEVQISEKMQSMNEEIIYKKLSNLSIYECIEELNGMIWKNMFKTVQNAVKQMKNHFKSKLFLLEIADLEIELLLLSFSGQAQQLGNLSEKVEHILKLIQKEQKNKPNFYDLCLCDINQAEMYLIKGIIDIYHLRESWKIFSKFESLEAKLLDSLKTNTLITQTTPLKNTFNKDTFTYVEKSSSIIPSESASKIRQIINKFHFGRGFFSVAFAYLPEGILSFLKLLGYSSDPSVGIKWLEKCIENNSIRSNYASILLSLHYVERKNSNEQGIQIIRFAQLKNGKISSICLSWIQSLILMNLEEASQAEEVLRVGLLQAKMREETDFPLCLDMVEYELCWLEIVQMKWLQSLKKLEEIICKSIDLPTLTHKSKKNERISVIISHAQVLQQQKKMQIPLKLHMLMHLACCFIAKNDQNKAKAYFQICCWEYAAKPTQKKTQEDISRMAEKYIQRQNLQYIQYEIHYLLKQTSKLSDSFLLKLLPEVKAIWLHLISDKENQSQFIAQKASISCFLAVINCFVGKNSENEDLYLIINQLTDEEKKPYDYIMQHFFFWVAMSFFHRKMHQKALEAFEKARKHKKIEFSIQEKIEKNISQLKQYIEKEKAKKKLQLVS